MPFTLAIRRRSLCAVGMVVVTSLALFWWQPVLYGWRLRRRENVGFVS